MDLWIRSQKNEKLRPLLLKVYEIEIGDYDDDMNCIVVNNLHCVGTYKSKERTLKVLDEIQEVLCPKVLIMKPKSQITISDNVNLVLPDNCSYERIGDTYVYEMPEE